MGKMLSPILYQSTPSRIMFHCPGCKHRHAITIAPDGNDPVWQWNADVVKPTFHPSLVVHMGSKRICHSFIIDGSIKFLSDSWHELKEKTVPIPVWPNYQAES